jgi:hypothetical protein
MMINFVVSRSLVIENLLTFKVIPFFRRTIFKAKL